MGSSASRVAGHGSVEQSVVAAEVVDAVEAASRHPAGDGDVLAATLAELDRRYATADEAVERALAYRRTVSAARDVVKARAASRSTGPASGTPANELPAGTPDDDPSSDTVLSDPTDDARDTDERNAGDRDVRGAVDLAVGGSRPSAHRIDHRAVSQPAGNGDAGTGRNRAQVGGGATARPTVAPAAVSWPTGPRTGVDLHKRSNYGRIIGCVAAGVDRQSAVRDLLGLKQNATQMAMKKLVTDGYLLKQDDGRYELTEKGRAAHHELVAIHGGGKEDAAV